MDGDDSLKQYISLRRDDGVSDDVIKQELTDNGWDTAVVDEALSDQSQSEAVAPAEPATIEEALKTIDDQPVQSPAVDMFGFQPAAAQQAAIINQQPKGPVLNGKYTIKVALSEALTAFRTNSAGIGVMMLVGFIVSVIGSVVVFIAGFALLFGILVTLGGSDSGMVNILLAIILVIAIYAFAVLPAAFTQSIIGLSINDGADNRKSRLGSTLALGLKRMFKVLVALYICSFLAFMPSVIALILVFVVAPALPGLAFWISIVAGVLAVGATLWILSKIIIMPVIALLEEGTSVFKLLGRTRQLMSRGGSAFTAKFIILFMVLIAIMALVLPDDSSPEGSPAILSYGIGLVLLLFNLAFSAILVVFYRNRQAIIG